MKLSLTNWFIPDVVDTKEMCAKIEIGVFNFEFWFFKVRCSWSGTDNDFTARWTFKFEIKSLMNFDHKDFCIFGQVKQHIILHTQNSMMQFICSEIYFGRIFIRSTENVFFDWTFQLISEKFSVFTWKSDVFYFPSRSEWNIDIFCPIFLLCIGPVTGSLCLGAVLWDSHHHVDYICDPYPKV